MDTELGEGEVFGGVQQCVEDRVEDVTDSGVAVDPSDFVGVIDRHQAGFQRGRYCWMVGDEFGECVVSFGGVGAGVAGGSEVGGEGAVAVGVVGASGDCGRDDSGPLGVKGSELELVGAEGSVEFAVGRINAVGAFRVLHGKSTPNICSMHNEKRRFLGAIDIRRPSAGSATLTS